MKIAFYLPNKHCAADCTNIDAGNPGIGGTEYMIIALSYYLTIRKNGHNIYLFAQNDTLLPKQCNIKSVNNVRDALFKCKEETIDCLVVQNSPETNSLFNEDLGKLKIIIWGHSFMSRKQWNLYARSSNVKRIVCVGHEELELYCDHRAYLKSTIIYNAFPFPKNNELLLTPNTERKNEVTFLASIVPHTNFHLLAESWKKVVKVIPDAHLNVIGSGNLYDKTKKLGKYNIAIEEYEERFMPYLLDENGSILSSVTFWGKLGTEKYDILRKTKVGVANPGGYETFCISAIEMQLYGAKVVSCKKGGLLDTVYDENDLFKNVDDCADYIIKALRSKEHDYDKLYNFLIDNFSFDVVCNEWESLLYEVENDSTPKPIKLKSKHPTIYHRLRYLNRTIKSVVPFGYYWMPCCKFYESLWNRLKSVFI